MHVSHYLLRENHGEIGTADLVVVQTGVRNIDHRIREQTRNTHVSHLIINCVSIFQALCY